MKAIMYTLFIMAILIPRESTAVSPHHTISHLPGFSQWLQKPFLADSSSPVIKDYAYYRSKWKRQRSTGWWMIGFGTAGFLVATAITANDLSDMFIESTLTTIGTGQANSVEKSNPVAIILGIAGLAMIGTGIGLLISAGKNKRRMKLTTQAINLNPGIPGMNSGSGTMTGIGLSISIGK